MTTNVTLPQDRGSPPRRPPLGGAYGGPERWRRWWRVLRWALVVLVPAAAWSNYWWFVQRVEVPSEHVLVLVRKVGDVLPAPTGDDRPAADGVSDQVVLFPQLLKSLGEPADSTRYRGITYDVMAEGRYFYDPFLWERIIVPAVVIGPDEVGVKVRRYGKPLPSGKLVATTDDERGPLAEVLPPGRHNINPFAYDLKRVQVVTIPPGSVGVQRLFSGDEPADPNTWVVKPGERGIQPDVLPPARYYNNPYVRRIDAVDVRTRILDLHDDDAIRFPSNDSFEIVIDVRIEYAVRQDMAPYVLVAIGDHEDVEDKLIRPYTRSLARIEGSKMRAREFISGEMRITLGDRVLAQLREQCWSQGIEIRDAKFRRIIPPQEIAAPIKDRQLAEQQIAQYRNEINVAESKAKLAELEELQNQNRAVGEISRAIVATVTEAQQRAAVALTAADQRLAVAKLALDAAKQNAQAVLSRGKAEADVIRLEYEAQAAPLREAVSAFGDGDAYAQFYFVQKLGPALRNVMASADGPLGEMLKSLSMPVPATATPRRTAPQAGRDGMDVQPAAHVAPLKGGE